jgi:hypothetical protein
LFLDGEGLGKIIEKIMITKYHAKYYAHEITREGGKGIDRLSRSIFDACVDLNPHQIEAALFSLKSPLTKGVLLSDEVGLGKTIEAGLVMSQLWAERKRKMMVICPASLRKQWALELLEKFNIPSLVLDAKSYRLARKEGELNPFDRKEVVILSTHFASRYREEIRLIGWDLAVIDEAHKLRNAYRPSNKMGKNIRWALEDSKKLLLTATPLQNSLLELFGLSTIIDERIFGDRDSFRSQYMNAGGDLNELRERLQYFSKRTLRRQVTEYIRYTARNLITRPFTPSEKEQGLYEAVTEYLQRDDSYAMPPKHKHLTALIIRKLLASSSRAVAGTLETMRDRLKALKENLDASSEYKPAFFAGEDGYDEDLLDELVEIALDMQEEQEGEDDVEEDVGNDEVEKVDERKLDEEIEELDQLVRWARGIETEAKSVALLKALKIGFSQTEKMQAAQKAIIFTESRRTQKFLFDYLEANGYAGKVITFNGTNREPHTTVLYQEWLDENKDTGRASGSRPVDVRAAIIENFRDHAQIMVATEAAAEGINLQFCSLVINYDLPWNPQRIEQRIGRCHRYGQKFDVVVINFLNQRNEVDQRVYELLSEKFKLFSGVFGASDEVLGSIESGVDFERRVLDIYEQCRTPKEIDAAFRALRKEMDEKISERMAATKKQLLENFDEDVHQKLKTNLLGTRENLDAFSSMFWQLTKYLLDGKAVFDDVKLDFLLQRSPIENAKKGRYRLISKEHENVIGDFLYRLSHPLGEFVLAKGKKVPTPTGKVVFNITDHPTKISMVEALKHQSGWLTCQFLEIDSFEHEEQLLFSGFDEEGNALDQEVMQKLFTCTGKEASVGKMPFDIQNRLEKEAERHAKAAISWSLEENNKHFNQARERLDKWAEDMMLTVENELKETKDQIKRLNREARLASGLDEQHAIQQEVKKLEKKKRKQRMEIFEKEDQIEEKRDALIENLESRMTQNTEMKSLFTVAWEVI